MAEALEGPARRSLPGERSGDAAPPACLIALVQELLKEEVPSRVAALIEKLFEAAGSLAGARGGAAEIEECAISLWNWTVTKHTASVINDEQRAKLRFVACRLVCLCEGSDPSEATIRRQILMSMKTGKGWIDIGKADLADGFLEIAMSSIEKLYAKLLEGSNGEADIHAHKADVEKSVFKVLSYQAESAVAQGDFQRAMTCVQRCKDMLMKLPKETCYLSILCYNFGVETYEQKKYEQSSFWLSQSYDIGKMDMKYTVGKEMQAKSYSEALHWYNYSASFYTPGQIDQNLAKLQRNMASCYLHLKQVDKAKEAVKEAERCDPSSIFTKFSVYKIAVMEKDTDKAVEAVIEMGKLAEKSSQCEDKLRLDENTGTNLLSLAAQIALENEQQVVAIKALEYLSAHLQDCRQLFAALKCLVRLMLSKIMSESEEKRDEDIGSMLTYLALAHKRLAESFTEEKFTGDARILEAHWFRKVAWNLAVQFNSCPEKMRDFFLLSFKLSQFCPSDKAVLIAQRTCLLMAAAVDLEMGRQQVKPSEQAELLTQALQHLQTCKEVWKVLKFTGDFAKDPTDTLLLLYEFEARSKLNDPTLHNFMESVWEQPQIEVKTLEIIASLAMESPARYPVLCKKALKSALNIHRKQPVIDAVKFSKCLHSLINLSLPTGVTDLDACVLQEVWGYFEDGLSVVSSTDAYPETEVLWLMTRAWNTGIFQYTVGKYKEAEQWCGLGMRFLNQLGSLKKSYEGHPPAQSLSPSLTQISCCSLLCYSGPLVLLHRQRYQSLLCLTEPGRLAGGWPRRETLPKHLVPF
ncbi:testis-expressed protein 11 isoform X9 [Cuculus canorus]|uniref:testis-expressed protein 11 isoform X9 n=1 Tax=Cuculus canorus TaxID=55661 RepID=UPI0023AA5EAA|nr:testis-expressed protein 11 isoform X9 [Cuculus canorus]